MMVFGIIQKKDKHHEKGAFMKKGFFALVMAVMLVASGLLLTGCADNGGGGGEAASVANTTWLANATRSQFAQLLVIQGEFANVLQAEAFLAIVGVPETFPAARVRFQAAPNLTVDVWDFGSGAWVSYGSGTWQQSGNVVTAVIWDESHSTTIQGDRFTMTEYGMTLAFYRQ